MKIPQAVFVTLFIAFIGIGPACADKADKENKETQKLRLSSPQIPDHFIFRPEFLTKRGRFNAGTAFAIDLEGQERFLIITAVHLFGPDGGLPEQIPSQKLPAYVDGVVLYDAFTSEEVTTAGPVLYIPEAVSWDKEDGKDIAAFWAAKDNKIRPAQLAIENPKAGETVWLAAPLIKGESQGQRLHRAVVTVLEKGAFNFRYDNRNLVLNATSGAPVLNSEGKVVGINVGAVGTPNMLVGIATAVEGFRPLLIKAINRPAQKPVK